MFLRFSVVCMVFLFSNLITHGICCYAPPCLFALAVELLKQACSVPVLKENVSENLSIMEQMLIYIFLT